MSRRRKSKSTWPPDRATNPMLPWLHGLAAMGDERWEEATAAIRRFLEMAEKPKDRQMAYQNLGACYLALERYDEALAALDEVERYAPNDPDALASRGVTFGCAARIPEAIAAFELLARRWPRLARQHGHDDILKQLRQIQRGDIPAGTFLVDHLQEQIHHNLYFGDLHLVERKARRMIAADPNRPEGHFALGVACAERGRHAEALEAFLAAQSRDPNYAPTLYNIGHTYLQMGDLEQAVAWLERAVRRDPKHLPALHQLGLAYERLGRRDEAVGRWRRALQIDPTYYLVQERLHEVGKGPAPVEPPLPPTSQQLRTMMPIVKARMKRPEVYHNGGLTLTCDPHVGFVLEDADNPRNATIHAGGPFNVGKFTHTEDVLDLIGLVKMLLGLVNSENTRDVAVLVYYYDDRPVFNYQIRFARGQQVEQDADGHFVVTEKPRLFKLRIDSDLSSPYGDPMQGMFIYLDQRAQPGVVISTLGLADEQQPAPVVSGRLGAHNRKVRAKK